MQWGLPRRLVTVQLSPPDVLISSHLSSIILEPLNQLFFLLVSASQRPISRLLFAAGSWRGVSSYFHRRHRPSSSSSIVHRRRRRRRPSSSSSSIVVVITHHRHHTLLPSHSPLYSHVIAILILVSSLFAIVSSPPTQPITIVSSPPTHPITIVYSLSVVMPTPTVAYSSPLNPDRTIVAVPSFFALRRRSWLIVIRHHLLTVFITTRVPTTWKLPRSHGSLLLAHQTALSLG